MRSGTNKLIIGEARAYLDNPILVDIVEHLIQNGRDNFLRTAGDGESDGGGIEIARESLRSENWFSLEEIPFTFVLDQGNNISNEKWPISVMNRVTDGGRMPTDHRWLPISAIGQSSP